MTNDDLIVSIRGVVKEEIETALEPVFKKLDGLTEQLADVSVDVSEIKDALKSHETRISAVEDKLDLPTPVR